MTILEDIFGYAYRGGGKYILLICTVLSAEAQLASFAPAIGFIAWWLLFGYFCAIYLFLTNGRILGVVYRERQEEMGWN